MKTRFLARTAAIALAACLVAGAPAYADVVSDWNQRSGRIVVDAKLGTPPAMRVMALVQTATLHALEAVAGPGGPLPPAAGDAAAAAVAAAHRTTLLRLLPAQQAAIDAAYDAALATLGDSAQRRAGVAAGERAAAELLAARAADVAAVADDYRPHTTPGTYVPTAAAAASTWPRRRPWLLARADQFRPGPPPALASAAWARDYDEVRSLGARASARRSPEQTEIAKFWEYSLPPIYFGVVQSVAQAPGRDALRNARLYAAAAQALDDALIAVFDAKYHHHFWRPVTAIRNGDLDGNDATVRDPAWASLIEAPMHPEYPSGHAILAAAVGAVLRAEVGDAPPVPLATTSPTAQGATRRWARVDDFVSEVGESRIVAGIHFRSAIDAGIAMGERIGRLAAQRLLRAPH